MYSGYFVSRNPKGKEVNLLTNKLLVIGFDGMTWDVLRKAETPTIDSMIKRGGQGILRSTNPPVTCPAWPTYLTGQKPINHRVFDFVRLNEHDSIELNEYGNIESPTLIDVMDQTDTSSIFFEIPMTFPVPDTNQTVLGGYPAENTDEKYSSKSLREDLKSTLGVPPPISPVRFAGQDREGTLRELFEATEYRFEAFQHLLRTREWDFATINFHLSDQIGHFFWDDFVDNSASSAPVQAYELLDRKLEKLLDEVDHPVNVILMSDHGHGKQNHTINLNHILREEGFLDLSDSFSTHFKSTLARTGISPGGIKKLLDNLGVTQFLPDWNRGTIDSLLDKFLSYRDVDWEASEAFAFGHVGQIYWIGEDDQRLEALKTRLHEITLDGEPLVSEIISLRDNPEDTSPSMSEPMWLVNMCDWSAIAYPLFLGRWDINQTPTDEGCHRPEGILAWSGPDLANLSETVRGNLTDLAPTLLHLLDLPLQHDFDGTILNSLLSETLPMNPKTTDYGGEDTSPNSHSDDEERIDQLKNLGYL